MKHLTCLPFCRVTNGDTKVTMRPPHFLSSCWSQTDSSGCILSLAAARSHLDFEWYLPQLLSGTSCAHGDSQVTCCSYGSLHVCSPSFAPRLPRCCGHRFLSASEGLEQHESGSSLNILLTSRATIPARYNLYFFGLYYEPKESALAISTF